MKFKKSLIVVVLLMVFLSQNTIAQEQCPGRTVVGYGYNIFGHYANNKSVKEPIFDFSSNSIKPMDDGKEYKIPSILSLKYINEKDYLTTEGRSLREYASSMSVSSGVSYDGLLFSASVESRFGKSKLEQSNNYFYTITDRSRIWKVYINPLKKSSIKKYVNPDVQVAIDNMDPKELIEILGTHYVASGYFGGSMDYSLSESFKSKTEMRSVSVAVQAKYSSVSASSDFDFKSNEVNENFKSNVKIHARGGSVQYANKSSVGDNSQYNLWVESIPEKAVLIDFMEGSLVPIWTLASTPERAAEIEAVFNVMLAKYPLPEGNASAVMSNQTFIVQSISNKLYLDIPNLHVFADKMNGAKVITSNKDKINGNLEGIDRVLKLIPSKAQPGYLQIQPQHSDMVYTVNNNSGTTVKLGKRDVNTANVNQLFKLEEVKGKDKTFYIKTKNELYLTAGSSSGSSLTQTQKTGAVNQQWYFESIDAFEIAPLDKYCRFSIQNIANKKYINAEGRGHDAKGRSAKLDLEGMTKPYKYAADRYYRLKKATGDGNFFLIFPNHKNTNAFNVTNGAFAPNTRIELWTENGKNRQHFEFVYAGEPMTYFIRSRQKYSGKYLVIEADKSKIGLNAGTPVQLGVFNGGDNQKWKLDVYNKYVMPPKGQSFLVKSAYCNNEYWDPNSDDAASNRGIKNWAKNDGSNGKPKSDRWFKIGHPNNKSWINIYSAKSSKYVSLQSNSSQIILNSKNNKSNQRFAFEFVTPTMYRISTTTGKVLDVEGDSNSGNDWKSNGKKIQANNKNFDKDKMWQLEYPNGKVYSVKNK